jgi:hypothetical protein
MATVSRPGYLTSMRVMNELDHEFHDDWPKEVRSATCACSFGSC